MLQQPPITNSILDGWLERLVQEINPINVFYPSANAVDQGVATASKNSIKDYVDGIGTSKKATLILRHNKVANTTTYTLTTSETIPSNISLIMEPGAIIDGAGTLTLDRPEQFNALPNQQIFGSSITISFTNDGTVYLEWLGGAGDNSTDNTVAFSSALASMSNPSIKLLQGTYQHNIITATSKAVSIIGSGKEKTILKNIHSSNNGISLTTCHYARIQDLTINNNSKPSHAFYATGSTYIDLQRLSIENHGNSTITNKWGIYLTGCSLSELSDIMFKDIDTNYGGHLFVHTSYFSVFRNITSGRASNDTANGLGLYLDVATGCNFHGLYIEEGGGTGLIKIDSTEAVNIFSFTTELSSNRSTAGDGHVKILNSKLVKFSGGRFYQAAAAATEKPYFNIEGSDGVHIDGFNFDRRTNNSSDDFIQFGANNENIKIENIRSNNTTDSGGGTGVGCHGVDTDNNAMENLKIENWYEEKGEVTHRIWSVTKFVGMNINSAIHINGGSGSSLINCDGTITFTGEHIYHEGKGSNFQNLQISNTTGTLSGASVTLTMSIPTNCLLVGAAINVEETVADDGGDDTWDAEFNDGAQVVAIGAAFAAAQNTKADKVFNNADLTVTDAITNIKFTPNGGNFTQGKLKAIAYYIKLTSLSDA